MEELKFPLRERALHEAAFSVSELTVLVVTPEKEGSVVKTGHAMTLAAHQFF